MGIDTRFFGPSAWRLFHYIAFHSKNPQTFLKNIGEILPCKFCRESTKRFISEMSVRGTLEPTDPGKWLYDLHNRVNNKLRTQCADDPNVVNPGPDPSFEEVKKMYDHEPKNILGRDFLFSIAVNYDGKTPHIQQRFLEQLSDVYPKDIKGYMKDHPPALESNKSYMKWMYGLLSSLGPVPTYRGYVQRLMYYTSGCERKTYKGKTCRRVKVGASGFRTKSRDTKKTYRVTHAVLN